MWNVLELRLLGQIEVTRKGERVERLPSRKSLALLAYLAATGRRHRRERLCSIFWEVPDDPRASLRWSLTKLRAVVDQPDEKHIIADRDSVVFEPGSSFVDLLVVRAETEKGLENLSTPKLQELAENFRGKFIEGIELPDCHDFQAWCVAERDGVQALQAKIFKALIERFSDAPEMALRYARRLAEIDNEREVADAEVERLRAKVRRTNRTSGQNLTGLEPLQLPEKPSIAVMPFDNLSDDPDQEYFADGIAEDIITALSHMPWFLEPNPKLVE